jgi:hypothetical protein
VENREIGQRILENFSKIGILHSCTTHEGFADPEASTSNFFITSTSLQSSSLSSAFGPPHHGSTLFGRHFRDPPIPKPVLSSCRLYADCRQGRKQVSP